MEEIKPNLGSSVKFGGFLKLGIRWRVSYPFLLFVMCTRRWRIPKLSKQTHDIPSMKDPRLPVFALTLISMEDLDQLCDRRVESDFNTDSYRAVYQTSGGVGSVGNGCLRMRRLASLSTVSYDYIWMEQGILKLGRSGECRRRLTAHASAGSLCPYKEVFN